MKTEYNILKESTLSNNCPECYSKNSLVLSFKQKKNISKYFINRKGNILESLYCNKCENQIFPGQWTEDIERVYNYHKKTITPILPSSKLTKLSYILLALFLFLLIVIGIYLFKLNQYY